SEGYKQVGASFPVFLHPKSNEEYALARTERKQGHGYHGFEVEFDPGVSIEDDLLRRDLTINAIAKDEQGNLVDPFGGQRDIKDRVLRHVSPAFAEDPLRVLRVARFAARFADLGFSVHPQTLDLMRDIAHSGELGHLVAERSWREIYRAMGSDQPSVFLKTLRACNSLEVLLPELDALYGVPQDAKWHPEIDTGAHTELAMDFAAEKKFGSNVVFAVMLHDLGKGLTPKSELPAHHGHENNGIPLVDQVCERFRVPKAIHKLSRQVCAAHIRCHRVMEMRPAKIMNLLEQLDGFRQQDLTEFVQACEADYRGRKGLQDRQYPQAEYLQSTLETALSIQARDLLSEGVKQGPELGEKLRQARIQAISGMRP
ncbi:MAG: tRNA nucleotidyltransferase (CCA-adding enzyme), partial [Rhodothermales bacterium]